MKEIQLTQGKVAMVDDRDYDWLSQWKWWAKKDKGTFYAGRRDKGKNVYMHRVILGVSACDISVDHRDFNGLNNQKFNLRKATRTENASNRKSRGFSKYLGVSYIKDTGKWRAEIRKAGIKTHLGCFNLEEEAALEYNIKAIELHGDFANLNKIGGATIYALLLTEKEEFYV